MTSPMMTTVVTNFRRPEFLKRAIRSLAAAKVPNVVVSSCGATPDVEAVHRWALSEMPGITVVSRADDLGCNECWTAGVRAAKTEFIHILHDDDVVVPDFAGAAAHLGGEMDIVLVGAYFQCEGPEIPSRPSRTFPLFERPSGRLPKEILMERLMMRRTLSLSPINGIIRREFVLDALMEASKAFTGPEWFVRPGMMVGNDLLLWIRACERARAIHYDGRHLVGYCEHGESTTVRHCLDGKEGVLIRIYDQVRDYVDGVSALK